MNDLDDIWKILDKRNIATDAKTRSEISSFIKVAKSKKIQSFSDLLARFSEFTNKQKNIGIWLFGRLRNRKAVPLLLTLLNDDNNDAWEICASLGLLDGKKAIQGLKNKLEKERNDDTREAIVYALSFVFDESVAEELIFLAKNKKESPKIRAQAAEGLGYFLKSVKRSSSIYKNGFQCLTSLLKEKNINIRYNASFSLSNLKR